MRARLKVLSVVGARPNMMKVAPVAAALARRRGDFEHVLVDTGQHYDREMSQVFLEELGVGEPDYRLGVGSGTQAQQTARALVRVEEVLSGRPDIVLVVGDVNSTLACSLVAVKVHDSVATSRRVCGASTGACRRRSTGSSGRTCRPPLHHAAEADDNLAREGTRPERSTSSGTR